MINSRELRSCPKCGRELEPDGVITIGASRFVVYTCENCIVQIDFDGEKFDAAFSFSVNKSGQICNAETGEPF